MEAAARILAPASMVSVVVGDADVVQARTLAAGGGRPGAEHRPMGRMPDLRACAPRSRDQRAVGLREAIHRTGYYPEVVADGVSGAVPRARTSCPRYVHHEPTFDRDMRSVDTTVVVLTPTRLIVGHTDEHAADEMITEPYTSTSTRRSRSSRCVRSW